jgi:hypothetical protein
MHQTIAPEWAFLQIMPHGVAQVNASSSDKARLVYQSQCAQKTVFLDKKTPLAMNNGNCIITPPPPVNFGN